MKKYVISKAHHRDVPELKRIEIECELSPWTIEAYESELRRPDAVVLTARTSDNRITGFLVGRIPLSREGVAEIYNVGTLPSFRRERIGTGLLAEFRRICTERLTEVVWLEVRATNRAAIEFYRSHGFVSSGIRPNFYTSPTEDAKLMSLSLM